MTMAPPALTPADLFQRILLPEHRPNPYPLWAELRDQPVARTDQGVYLVSSHRFITQLLRDPRISADRLTQHTAKRHTRLTGEDGKPVSSSLLQQDPPAHDDLRRQVMHQFVPRITGMRPHIESLVAGLLDARAAEAPGQLDVVADLAYPLPVAIICELLGVPAQDEPIFREFARKLTRGLDPVEALSQQELAELLTTRRELRDYLIGLIRQRHARPGNDLLSGLMTGGDGQPPMAVADLISTLGLLLIAGHETTVNLIANGTLALLRHPEALARLRDDPHYAAPLVEEVLRYDPPVQMTSRSTLAPIALGPVTVPAGSRVTLLLAAGNRDPHQYADPETFRPERPEGAHISFGSGLHYCVGAALARMEAQVALTAIARRLQNPSLVTDPPPYRDNAILRGPESLPVAYERLTG